MPIRVKSITIRGRLLKLKCKIHQMWDYTVEKYMHQDTIFQEKQASSVIYALNLNTLHILSCRSIFLKKNDTTVLTGLT